MEVAYTEKALKDLEYWRKIRDKRIQERISDLVDNIRHLSN